MTKKRRKELLEEWAAEVAKQHMDGNLFTMDDIDRLIRTVAAESWKEGMKEAQKTAGDAMFSGGRRIEVNGERYIRAADAEKIARGVGLKEQACLLRNG